MDTVQDFFITLTHAEKQACGGAGGGGVLGGCQIKNLTKSNLTPNLDILGGTKPPEDATIPTPFTCQSPTIFFNLKARFFSNFLKPEHKQTTR